MRRTRSDVRASETDYSQLHVSSRLFVKPSDYRFLDGDMMNMYTPRRRYGCRRRRNANTNKHAYIRLSTASYCLNGHFPLSLDTCPMCRLLRWTELNSSEQPRWNTLLRTNRTLVVLVSLQPGKFTVHLPSTVKTFLFKQSYPDIIQLVMALKWPIMCWCAVKKLLTPVSGPCNGCTN